MAAILSQLQCVGWEFHWELKFMTWRCNYIPLCYVGVIIHPCCGFNVGLANLFSKRDCDNVYWQTSPFMAFSDGYQGLLLLTWFNFNPSMDK